MRTATEKKLEETQKDTPLEGAALDLAQRQSLKVWILLLATPDFPLDGSPDAIATQLVGSTDPQHGQAVQMISYAKDQRTAFGDGRSQFQAMGDLRTTFASFTGSNWGGSGLHPSAAMLNTWLGIPDSKFA